VEAEKAMSDGTGWLGPCDTFVRGSKSVQMRCFMHKTSRFVAAIVVFSALALALPASSAMVGQGRGRGQDKKTEKAVKHDGKDQDDKHQNKEGKNDGRPATVVVDRDGHLRVIHEYAHGGALPPGLAKRQALPPGLREQLRENGRLPPGLQKRLVVVPGSLGRRLPPVPPYYRRYFAGDDLLVIDSRTNQIVAILRDVWR
jgi:hypothetical protein